MFSVWSNILNILQGLEASLNKKKLYLSFFPVLRVMSHSVETCLKQVLFQFRMERVRDLTKGFCQFCQSTSIHGLRYIGDKEKNVTSRIIWLVILVTSFMAAAYIISESVQGFYQIHQLEAVLIQSPDAADRIVRFSRFCQIFWRACLKRRHVYVAVWPRGRSAKIIEPFL